MNRPTSRPTPTRALACCIAVLLAVAGVVVSGPAAHAHDVLRSSDPADGSTVREAPAQVTLTFDQPALALGTQVVVLTPDGRDAASGEPVLVDSTVTQALDGALPAGEYTVEWRVTSSDGHPIDGTFTFTATASSGETPTPAPTPMSSGDPTTAVTPSSTASASPVPTPSASALPVIDPGPAGGGPAAWLVGGLVVLLVVGAVVVVVSAVRDSRRH